MDGADPGGWSAVADGWAELWGDFAEPAWAAVVHASGVGPGHRALDVGCGSGDLLAHLDELGVRTAGVDPAPGMVERARERVPAADIRPGEAERLPWPDASFDLVTAVNALQFADDPAAALRELVRVTTPGGHVAIVSWADRQHNDLDTIEAALAEADGEEPRPDGDLRMAGGIEGLLGAGGLEVVASGLVEVTWLAVDDDTLVRGVLLGEDPRTVADMAPTVITAAEPFRTSQGGYLLVNHFRYGVGRRVAEPDSVGRTRKG